MHRSGGRHTHKWISHIFVLGSPLSPPFDCLSVCLSVYQALLANMSAMFAVYHGPKGIQEIANRWERINSRHTLADPTNIAIVNLAMGCSKVFFSLF